MHGPRKTGVILNPGFSRVKDLACRARSPVGDL
jgi:hypothetical protein